MIVDYDCIWWICFLDVRRSLSKHLSSKKGSRTSNCGNRLEFTVLTFIQNVPWITRRDSFHFQLAKMVHNNRNCRGDKTVVASKAILDISPPRNSYSSGAPKLSSSPPMGPKLEVPERPLSSMEKMSSNAWAFNEMVSKNRQQFNALHFC